MFLENIVRPMFKTFQQSQPALMNEILNDSKKTPQVQDQMKKKYSTFVGFSYREAYHESKQKKKRKNQQAKLLETDLGAILQLFMQNSLITAESKPQIKGKNSSLGQLPGIKSERRERFRKGVNTFLIIKHYIQKQNFKPTQQQMYLMRQLAEMKQLSDDNNLDSLQQKIYKLMNEAVDFNQLKFLSLLILLSADISFSFKDMSRSFFFYNQARIFASYSELYHVKIEALKQMGLIAMQQKMYKQSITLLKKALQYAWKIKNTQMQILIYDYLGEVFYYEGEIRQSQYYHKRFSQGESQSMDSAVRRLSSEMLHEYANYLKSMEKQHLTSLFLQYIQLPIVGHQIVPPPPNYGVKMYLNFNEEGESPRKNRASHKQTFKDFQSVHKQIQNLLELDFQFATVIPNPDVQKNFIVTQKFGRPRKMISFEKSAECHKITHKTMTKLDFKSLQVNSLQKRIEIALTSRVNDDWLSKIKDKIKNNQKHMIGKVKDRIYNSHMSYYKYPEQRRRAQSFRSQKIKQSFNKTLLDWIDPLK